MNTFREILWYGRGGQGAFSAAKLLGAAYALTGENRYSLAFPSFGPERRGAPVRAYTKLGSVPINDRSAVAHPDHIVCLDETLLADLGSLSIKEGGSLIAVNEEVIEFSRQILGREIVNTTLLSLLALELGDLSADDVVRGIEETMPPRIQAKNIELVRAVFERADELQSAVHVARAPQRQTRPHERNVLIGGAEYMDIMTADVFGGSNAPQQEYHPAGEGEEGQQ